MIDYYAPNLDLTLTGCGFLANYHIGTIILLSQIWPQKPFNRICGSSCGGAVGAMLAAGVSFEVTLAEFRNIITELRGLLRRPKFDSGGLANIVERCLERALPQDAHERCSEKLGLSLTKFSLPPFENEFVHQFRSRKDLIEAVVAGCYIPLWAGLKVPHFRGKKCLDGAYSDNKPKFRLTDNERLIRQVEICPFSGEIEVSPPEKWALFMWPVMGTRYYFSWDNTMRTNHAMLPLDPASYKQFLLDGHRDMKEFVLKSNLVKCLNCHQRDGEISEERGTIKSCLACLRLLEQVDSLRIPDEMLKMLNS